MHITTTEVLALAAGGAILAPFIGAISSTYSKLAEKLIDTLTSLFFVRISLPNTTAILAVTMLLRDKGRAIRWFSTLKYKVEHVPLRYEPDRSIWWKEEGESSTLFLYRKTPIFFKPAVISTKDSAGSEPQILFLRWTLNWNKLSQEALEHYGTIVKDYFRRIEEGSRRHRVRFHVGNRGRLGADASRVEDAPPSSMTWASPLTSSSPVGVTWDEIGHKERTVSPLENLALGPESMKIVQDFKFWIKHKQWYLDRGIPWRRGYLLFGRPGTGKTSLGRAMSDDADVPVEIFNLASMSDLEFHNAWKVSSSDLPYVVVFEDFDRVFNGREPRPGVELTFDTVLNAIDGIQSRNGMCLIITTNQVECIDPALGCPDSEGGSTRPGRIDLAVEIPPLNYECRFKVAIKITQDPKVSEELALKYDGDTAVKFQERCIQWAKAQLRDA